MRCTHAGRSRPARRAGRARQTVRGVTSTGSFHPLADASPRREAMLSRARGCAGPLKPRSTTPSIGMRCREMGTQEMPSPAATRLSVGGEAVPQNRKDGSEVAYPKLIITAQKLASGINFAIAPFRRLSMLLPSRVVSQGKRCTKRRTPAQNRYQKADIHCGHSRGIRPGTRRTLRGAAIQIAAADVTQHTMATAKASQ